jgi:hypothetical protein
VTARTSASAFRDTAVDVRDIARRLGVRTVIEGSVQHAGDTLRVTVQLIDGADGCHIWSRHFDHVTPNIFAAQDEIARAVVAPSSALVCSCAKCLIVSHSASTRHGPKNKVQRTVANLTPDEMLTEAHREMAEPGIGKQNK